MVKWKERAKGLATQRNRCQRPQVTEHVVCQEDIDLSVQGRSIPRGSAPSREKYSGKEGLACRCACVACVLVSVCLFILHVARWRRRRRSCRPVRPCWKRSQNRSLTSHVHSCNCFGSLWFSFASLSFIGFVGSNGLHSALVASFAQFRPHSPHSPLSPRPSCRQVIFRVLRGRPLFSILLTLKPSTLFSAILFIYFYLLFFCEVLRNLNFHAPFAFPIGLFRRGRTRKICYCTLHIVST